MTLYVFLLVDYFVLLLRKTQQTIKNDDDNDEVEVMGKYIYYSIVVVVDGCVSGHGEQKESIINGCNIQEWSNFKTLMMVGSTKANSFVWNVLYVRPMSKCLLFNFVLHYQQAYQQSSSSSTIILDKRYYQTTVRTYVRTLRNWI